MEDARNLSSYRRVVNRIHAKWPAFLEKRKQRLVQAERHGMAAEKVAENIVEDLFTEVLDWSLGDLNNQLQRADIVLTSQGIKQLIVETKRPGSLAWNETAVRKALAQALGYAAQQRVRRVAISDGAMLYAADVQDGGLMDRVFIPLISAVPPEDLWWLSIHGIYRPTSEVISAPRLLPYADEGVGTSQVLPTAELLHPKYQIPARNFAYVGDASKTSTWKLPYLLVDGTIDTKRLPKAIQSIVSNYRGAKVSKIPEQAIPAVLVRLARAAASLGHMPPVATNPAPAYKQLHEALEQWRVDPDDYLMP